MSLSKSRAFVSGTIFGSALTLSNVASPRIIKDQFKLSDFHMLLTFLSASASSAIVFAIYNSRQQERLPLKKDSSYGWIARFDGNMIGGAALGVGMAVSGACPGTALVQAVAGIENSRSLAVGCLLGGVIFVKLRQYLDQAPHSAEAKHTVMEMTRWSQGLTLLAYESLMIAAIAVLHLLAPRGHYLLHPALGGILLGLGQVASVLLTKKPVGVSTAYEELGRYFWATIEGKAKPATESIFFSAGILTGARLVMYFVPATLQSLHRADKVSWMSAICGGGLLTFGARLAGGCTSGHGISGMSAMGLSSFVTITSTFVSAITTTFWLS
ncbi:hypothetical protein H2204_006221 [Knufia peltigerae]|uniref:Sulphur transport domain-containing protein n=1 Tax=Knufia peltigerae TaxID=1002370 RepID=A0AA39CXR2_9EURO|nr:hypothetical protein H2204_006221 [Knufia peltigerae]